MINTKTTKMAETTVTINTAIETDKKAKRPIADKSDDNNTAIETDKKAKRPIADTTDKTDKSDDNNTAKRKKTEKKTALENAKAIYEAFFMSGRATMTKEQIADHEKELAALLTNFVDELGRKPEERDQEKFLLQVRRKKPTDPRLESLENLVQEVDSRTLRTLIALLKDLTPIEAATTSILEPIMEAFAKMEAKVESMFMVNFNKEFVAAYGSLTKDDSKAHDDAITCIMEVMQAKVTKKKKKYTKKKKVAGGDDSDGASTSKKPPHLAVQTSIVSIMAKWGKDTSHANVWDAMKDNNLSDADVTALAEKLRKLPAKGKKEETKPREEANAKLQSGILPSVAFGITPPELAERFDKVLDQLSKASAKKRRREDDDIGNDDDAKRNRQDSSSISQQREAAGEYDSDDESDGDSDDESGQDSDRDPDLSAGSK